MVTLSSMIPDTFVCDRPIFNVVLLDTGVPCCMVVAVLMDVMGYDTEKCKLIVVESCFTGRSVVTTDLQAYAELYAVRLLQMGLTVEVEKIIG
ncbi:hypothetical protein [Scytonema sp. NUACC26]|uniref:hypothetical protein n=1 Tax=Scytonema sp. NUACC26 TaxID=3140176 RepID=UPI0034DBE0C1